MNRNVQDLKRPKDKETVKNSLNTFKNIKKAKSNSSIKLNLRKNICIKKFKLIYSLLSLGIKPPIPDSHSAFQCSYLLKDAEFGVETCKRTIDEAIVKGMEYNIPYTYSQSLIDSIMLLQAKVWKEKVEKVVNQFEEVFDMEDKLEEILTEEQNSHR